MTAQVHEELIFNGERISMAFCPPLPERHPRIVAVTRDIATHEDAHPLIFSSACWRCYQGTWEINDGQFSLVRLRGRYRLLGNAPVLADWFSGVLRIPTGELLQYVHMGPGSVYEDEIHVKIERGVVVRSRVIENRGTAWNEWDMGCRSLAGAGNRF